jgi:ABC-2 type transport system permease protein
MNAKQSGAERRAGGSDSAAPGWWIVAGRELTDLWFAGKGPVILILYSALLGLVCFVFATNVELALLSPRELMWMLLQVAYMAGAMIGLVLGADCFSGERDRETLEGLLLTPTSRTQIVVGKFLAACSPWPLAAVISVAYFVVLTPDQKTLSVTLLWGGVMGTLLAVGMTGLAMLVSAWSNSTKVSISISLAIFLLFLLPAQFKGAAQKGTVGTFVRWVNPVAATDEFTEKLIVNLRTLNEFGGWLLSPVAFTVLVLGLLFFVVGPRLGLEGGMTNPFRRRRGRVTAAEAATALLGLLAALPTMAAAQPPLQIAVSMESKQAVPGDQFWFDTKVTNAGRQEVFNVIVAMNIVDLSKGEAVDPEDWSPERTQYIEELEPGQSTTLSWTIHSVFQGEYLVYMVLIQKPAGPRDTTRPVASNAIHLTIRPVVKANPGGMLPVALATTGGLSLAAVGLHWARRRRIDTGTPRREIQAE